MIPDLLAAWETEDLMDPESPFYGAKLGGAGLALISMVHMERVSPGTTSLEELRQIGNFIEFMQHPEDGSFTCKFSYKHGKNDDWNSLYYPGEAALGLLYLAEMEEQNNNMDKKTKWMSVATKALLYLERYRRTEELEDIEPDHWALLATAKLLPMLEEYYENNAMEYWLIYNHGVKVAQSMVDSHTMEGLRQHLGCFTYDRRTCPTSTRLEGLLASLTFIREGEVYVGEEEHIAQPLRERIEESVALGVRFLLDAQQSSTENNMQGGVPACYPVKHTDDAYVQIDYVQHSMSAMMAYEKFVHDKKKNSNKIRQGVSKLKQFGAGVANRVVQSSSTVVATGGNNPDAYFNYFLLIVVIVTVLVIMFFVYMPRSRRKRVKRRD